jgi:hypothetical protein
LSGVAGLVVVVAVAVAWIFGQGHYHLAGASAAGAVLSVAGVVALVALARGRGRAAVMALALGMVAFHYVAVLRILPDVERLKPVPLIARMIVDRASPDARIAFFNMDLPSLVFYANRPVARVLDVEAALRLFDQHSEVWLLAGEREWKALRGVTDRACEAARHGLLTARADDLIARRPPPDVILVTTCR